MAIRSFPREFNSFAQDSKNSLSCRFNRQLPVLFAGIFVCIFRDFRLERSDGSCNVYQSVKLSAR
jgi:hypothetical protein